MCEWLERYYKHHFEITIEREIVPSPHHTQFFVSMKTYPTIIFSTSIAISKTCWISYHSYNLSNISLALNTIHMISKSYLKVKFIYDRDLEKQNTHME